MPDGTAVIDTFPPETRRRIERQVEEMGEGWRYPMPPFEELASTVSMEGVDEEQLALLRSRVVAQPFGTFTQPLRLENPARETLPKTGILCSFSLDGVRERIASGDPSFRGLAGPCWRFVELPTGHWPPCSQSPRTSRRCSSILRRKRTGRRRWRARRRRPAYRLPTQRRGLVTRRPPASAKMSSSRTMSCSAGWPRSPRRSSSRTT